MFNFDEPRYEKVVSDALALRPQIEAAVDEVCEQGYSNIFFIGCGGTWAHTLPMKYWVETTTADVDVHCEIAAEFLACPPKTFNKDSVCVFSTRTGTTPEIIAAAKFCQEQGARTLMYVSNDNTPATEYANYKFFSFAEDDVLCEAIYTYQITLVARLLKNAGAFPKYETFMEEFGNIAPFLIKAKDAQDERCAAMAEDFKDTDYHMVIGSGMLWGEAYDYAMCILEEMQWIKTKSIHAAEFFHGTIELCEEGTSLIMLYGEDDTRKLMDRVDNFTRMLADEKGVNVRVNKFDTAEVELPFSDPEFRKIVSPMVTYTITERLSCHLEHVRNHPLTTRRYYHQMNY